MPMIRTPLALISLAGGLAVASLALAQSPNASPRAAPPTTPPAPAATPPTLPDAAVTARENSQGPAHASDTAKENASPSSVLAPTGDTTTTATTSTTTTTDAKATKDKKKAAKDKTADDADAKAAPKSE
jgi:hypothetical protein